MSEKGHNCNLCKNAKCFGKLGTVCFGVKYRGKIIKKYDDIKDDKVCDEYDFGGFIELSENIQKLTTKVV